MKKTKALSLLLSLSLLCSFIMPGASAYAVDGAEEDNGMQIQKTAMSNGDGTYTIQLEAYATGEKLSTEVKKDVPTDIVLVLDQSGSMAENMNTYAFRAYSNESNSYYYNRRHNGGYSNLYYKLDDGSYVTVSVTRTQGEPSVTYTECPSDWYNDESSSWDDWDPDDYWKYSNNLYVQNDAGEYQKVTLTRKGTIYEIFGVSYEGAPYTYTYTFPDGETVVSEGDEVTPNFGNNGPLYYATSTSGEYIYTYTYTDADGNPIEIGTSSGADTHPTDFTLYERYSSGSVSRLEALKTAVNTFTNSVAEKAAGEDGTLGTDDDVNHRIAVVGYANDYDSNYTNTELFIGSTEYNYRNASWYYGSAFQDMSTTAGQSNVSASIRRLSANGSTYTQYGLEMANGILNANPVNENEKRSRVIILFTDGYPGYNAQDFDQAAANAAISQATTAKNNGVSVYSVGIFNGADATSAGNQNGTTTQAANWFMQQVSSNNGTPQNPSYYLSAADADTLNNIFQQISDNIESGGSATTLGEETVIKDLVSEYFQLPAGTDADDITVQTVPCTEIVNDVPTWGTPETFTGARVTVDEDTGTVSVSGFDFAGNYVGMDKINGVETLHNPAKKLVISFKVEPKDGFLGGNGVPTNAGAYIYENEGADKPVLEFNKPLVDVLIDPITVTASDKNVYLLGDLTAEQIREGASVKVGDVELKLGETNYGLEAWQYDYVKIEVTYQDKDGNTVEGLNDLKEDTTYTVSVKVTPSQTQGQATERSGSDGGAINVYKPELTFQDSEVYYGETVSTDFTANKVSEIWKHGGTASTDAGVVMTGEAPTLDITYTFDETKIPDGKVNTKQDIPVKAEVKIDTEDVQQYTTFVHQDCNPACGWDATMPDGDPAFLLHVKTCKLTIIKTGGTDGEPYVFSIYKDGEKYSEVTIVGNSSETIAELPVGTYTIEEDTGWSWRYPNPTYSDDVIILDRENPQGIIICTNTKEHDYWLNGFSDVVKNVYGAATQYIR